MSARRSIKELNDRAMRTPEVLTQAQFDEDLDPECAHTSIANARKNDKESNVQLKVKGGWKKHLEL